MATATATPPRESLEAYTERMQSREARIKAKREGKPAPVNIRITPMPSDVAKTPPDLAPTPEYEYQHLSPTPEYEYHLALEARDPLYAIIGQGRGGVEVMLVGLKKAEAEEARSELSAKYPKMRVMLRDLRWEIVLWPGRMAKSPRGNRVPRMSK